MRYIFGVLTIFIIGLSGCASSDYQLLQTQKPVKQTTVSTASIEYKILPQDRLKVILYKDPGQITSESNQKIGEDLNPGGFLVNAAGYIDLPLIGSVKVAGLTQSQAAAKIKRLYQKHLTKPSVYVEIMNKRIVVLGEVRKPGVIKIDKEKMTLFEALGFAGGFTDSAMRNNVIILSFRPGRGMTMRKVDLTRFDTLRYANLMLRPNDVVYVQPDSWKKFAVASSNYTLPFSTIAKIAQPFATLKVLFDN
jgi:polysaccharide export outer membrane protein